MNLINIPKKVPKGVVHSTFRSTLMNADVGYNIYLPPDYNESEQSYPVMYFLHGSGGDESSDIWVAGHLHNYLTNTDEKEIAPMLIVFPNGMRNSGYNDYYPGSTSNSPAESVIINELLPHIDDTYRTLASRENRVIEGFSMGGAGALFLVAKHPDLFCSVVSYAGGFWDWDDLVKNSSEEVPKRFNNDPEKRAPYTAHYWCATNADKIRADIKIKMGVGKKDFWHEYNIKMHKYLDSLEIPHKYDALDDIDHDIGLMYDIMGKEGLCFHSKNIQKSNHT